MTMDTAGNSTVDPELREHLENLEVEVTLSSERLRQDMVRGFIWTQCWLQAWANPRKYLHPTCNYG